MSRTLDAIGAHIRASADDAISEVLGTATKIATAEALGYASHQAYREGLRTGLTTRLQSRLLLLGYRVIIEPGPSGLVWRVEETEAVDP